MSANKHSTHIDWVDPDDAPELTDEFFEIADEFKGPHLVKRGDPKLKKCLHASLFGLRQR